MRFLQLAEECPPRSGTRLEVFRQQNNSHNYYAWLMGVSPCKDRLLDALSIPGIEQDSRIGGPRPLLMSSLQPVDHPNQDGVV